MRTLSLVDCVVLKFSGSVLKNAICFGDVDNDGLNEFVLGSSEGELSVYREDQCVCTATDLGTIAAVAVGDLLNISKNFLVAVTVEGWCHIFDVEAELASLERAFLVTEGDAAPPFLRPDTSVIWPYHSQRIPPNTKTLHLGDVNGDGLIEMVLGLTDRVVRTYQWKSDYQDPSDERADEGGKGKDGKLDDIFYGRLHGLNKWEFSSQVGSIALHKEEGKLSILVSQPGGTVKKITETMTDMKDEGTEASGPVVSSSTSTITSSVTSKGGTSGTTPRRSSEAQRRNSSMDNITIEYFSLDFSHMHNQNISCEVAGNIISPDEDDDEAYAVATLDGTIIIAKRNEIQWSFQVDHQIMSLFQVNGNIMACTWDGETYFIKGKVPIRFHFEDSVATFVPGYYAVREEGDSFTTDDIVNKLCMAFVTFDEKVYIYPVPLTSP